MTNDKMREEFEKAVALEAGEPILAVYLSRRNDTYSTSTLHFGWWAWKQSRAALPTWQPLESCPKHVDVLFFNQRNGVIAGRLTDADSFMTDKERDEWDGGEGAQFSIDAFGFGHWGVDRMEGTEAPTHWMPYPETPEVSQ